MNAKRHVMEVKLLPCVLCEKIGQPAFPPSDAHHAFDSAARSDWLTVALCKEHHQGATGFHGLGQREFERRYKTSEAELLALTIAQLR